MYIPRYVQYIGLIPTKNHTLSRVLIAGEPDCPKKEISGTLMYFDKTVHILWEFQNSLSTNVRQPTSDIMADGLAYCQACAYNEMSYFCDLKLLSCLQQRIDRKTNLYLRFFFKIIAFPELFRFNHGIVVRFQIRFLKASMYFNSFYQCLILRLPLQFVKKIQTSSLSLS